MSEEEIPNGTTSKSSLIPKQEVPDALKKVEILLKSVGDAPLMKKKKWLVEPDRTIGSTISFIKKQIALDQDQSLYLYVNQFFAPAPDQIMSNLINCFGSDRKLVLHYSLTPAWG